MKRPRDHVLEKESRVALLNFLPSEWIVREKTRDYGIDIEIEIVESGEVTEKVLWLQLKATEMKKSSQKKITYQMKTRHLKYYERCSLPVIILYWIKSKNSFYYIFAQRYIKENLSKNNLSWREQHTAAITFDSKLENPEDLESIATEGYFYILQEKLNIGTEKSAIYWLNGIPKSDNEELKERMLKIHLHLRDAKYPVAIRELEDTLRTCVLSPSEKMSVLLNLGNAYYSLSQNDDALTNYGAILEIARKIDEESALDGKSAALGNISLVYREKGDFDKALQYLEEAVETIRRAGDSTIEARVLGNMGAIYTDKGDLNKGLGFHEEALEIHTEMGNIRGKARDLGNIGVVYREKGDFDKAFRYFKDALMIFRTFKVKWEEANILGDIGTMCREEGNINEALKFHRQALEIFKEIKDRRGQANQIGNIGVVYSVKGDFDRALECHKTALEIHKRIGSRLEKARGYLNIGIAYHGKKNIDKALRNFRKSLEIFRTVGNRKGIGIALLDMGAALKLGGSNEEALECLNEALHIFESIGAEKQADIVSHHILDLVL